MSISQPWKTYKMFRLQCLYGCRISIYATQILFSFEFDIPGRCHVGSLFVNEEQEGLARDIIHMAATETVMPDALMTSQTWSKWQQGFTAFWRLSNVEF